MKRTFGTFDLATDGDRPTWVLTMEPAVRMRARRMFGKVQLTRSDQVTIADTDETCRDLAWFMERFPLEPASDRAAERLVAGTTAHERLEQDLQQLALNGSPIELRFDVECRKTPRPYQESAVAHLQVRKRFLLADDVGLGKTLTGLLAAARADARPALIVPPTHLPPRWEDEVRESFPELTIHVARKTTPPAKWLTDIAAPTLIDAQLPDILVIPYSRLQGWAPYLAGKIRTVIFDEVQELRAGLATLKGTAAAQVCEHADYVMGLSATPIHNYGGEIWNLYNILAPNQLGTREEFTREWISRGDHVSEPDALGNYLREQGLMLRRTRSEVGRQIPEAIKIDHLVDADHEALDDVIASAQALAQLILAADSTPAERWQAAGDIDWKLRQATGIDKAPYVADFTRMVLQSEQRVVMWGWHRAVYDIWMHRLAEFNPVLYTGSESPAQKKAAEAAFKAPYKDDGTDARILIMSLRSGAGVDGLRHVARVGIFGELDWSPAVHTQAVGRLERDGITDPPVIYFLHADHGSDPIILDVLQTKRGQSDPMLNDKQNLPKTAKPDTGRAKALAHAILRTKGTP